MRSDPPPPGSAANLWRASDPNAPDFPALGGDLTVDLAVIGGGFTGCSAALEAAGAGASVALIEGETIGFGGSGRNVGLVNAGLWLPPDQIRAQMGDAAGLRLIEALAVAPAEVFRLIETHAIDCEALRNGTLHLAHSMKGLAELEDRFRQGTGVGAPLRLLDRDETIRRTGSQAFDGALFDPRAGTIQPLAYCRGLARAAARAGAHLFERTPAREVTHDGRCWIIRAGGHSLRARHLLRATNGYPGTLPGTPAPAFVAVHYAQFATEPLTPDQRARILPGGEGCWDTALVMSSVRLDRAGRLIVGGVGNLAGPGGAVHRNWAARKLAEIYPELAGLGFTHQWEGRIAMTSDHIPKIVRIGPHGYSIFGYSGRGIGPGTVFGQRAARALLSGQEADLPLPSQPAHAEALQAPRAAGYEVGAVMSHAVFPSPLRPRRRA